MNPRLLLATACVPLCMYMRAETFSDGCLNFETTGETTCTLIASPSVSGTLSLPATVTYDNMTYTLTAIAPSALADARDLEALLVPGTVTTIGSSMARGCTSLRVVELGDGLATLGSEAFVGCTALEAVVLPDNLRAVPRRCFYGAAALRELRLGASISTIETQAFDGCTGLSSVVCMATVPPAVAPYAFDDDAVARAMLTVPGGCRPVYASEPVWRDFRSIIESDYGGAQVAFTVMFPDGRVTSTEYLGSRITLLIAPADGWETDALYLNGEDVTADIADNGYYTTPPLIADSTLGLVVRESAGIGDTAGARIRVIRSGDALSVVGLPAGAAVYVYTPDGRLLYSGAAHEGITVGASPVMVVTEGRKYIL